MLEIGPKDIVHIGWAFHHWAASSFPKLLKPALLRCNCIPETTCFKWAMQWILAYLAIQDYISWGFISNGFAQCLKVSFAWICVCVMCVHERVWYVCTCLCVYVWYRCVQVCMYIYVCGICVYMFVCVVYVCLYVYMCACDMCVHMWYVCVCMLVYPHTHAHEDQRSVSRGTLHLIFLPEPGAHLYTDWLMSSRTLCHRCKLQYLAFTQDAETGTATPCWLSHLPSAAVYLRIYLFDQTILELAMKLRQLWTPDPPTSTFRVLRL